MLLTRLNISLGIVAVPPPDVAAAGSPLAATGSSGRASDDAEDRSAAVGTVSCPAVRDGDAPHVWRTVARTGAARRGAWKPLVRANSGSSSEYLMVVLL